VTWRAGLAVRDIPFACESSYDGLIGSGGKEPFSDRRPKTEAKPANGGTAAHSSHTSPNTSSPLRWAIILLLPRTLRMLPASHPLPASAEQVHDQDHQGHNQQQVDQSAANMQTEPK